MNGLEITLLIAGLIIFAASFIFSSKSDKPEAKAELSEKQINDIQRQVNEVVEEQLADISEKNEIALDKISNVKMNEMNEYAETILSEINKNHNEVMFLYDMLNEKKKEVNNTVRDLNVVKKQIAPKDRKEKILDQLDAAAQTVSDDVAADIAADEIKKTRKKPSPAKNAAQRAKTTVKKETQREDNKDITVFENGNNNEKILELSHQGKSNVEIAKELGLGIGEVKLVVDLFRGGR